MPGDATEVESPQVEDAVLAAVVVGLVPVGLAVVRPPLDVEDEAVAVRLAGGKGERGVEPAILAPDQWGCR